MSLCQHWMMTSLTPRAEGYSYGNWTPSMRDKKENFEILSSWKWGLQAFWKWLINNLFNKDNISIKFVCKPYSKCNQIGTKVHKLYYLHHMIVCATTTSFTQRPEIVENEWIDISLKRENLTSVSFENGQNKLQK